MVDDSVAILTQHIQALQILINVTNQDMINRDIDERINQPLYENYCIYRSLQAELEYLKQTLEDEAMLISIVEADMQD